MDRWVPRWLWVATVLSAGLAVVAFRAAYAAEHGSRAGAEPLLAGLVTAVPLGAVAVVELFAAVGATRYADRSTRCWVAGTATAMALGVVALATWVLVSGSSSSYVEAAVVAAVLLAPLVPVRAALGQDRGLVTRGGRGAAPVRRTR